MPFRACYVVRRRLRQESALALSARRRIANNTTMTADTFWRRECGNLYAEDVALADIAAEFGTPCYVYSQAAITGALNHLRKAFAKSKPELRFAVKANGNLAILKLLAEHGAGFDIVSGGELARVIAAGGDVAKVVFSGVGKSGADIKDALVAGIGCFNVESAMELSRIAAIAADNNKIAKVALRVNPAIDGGAHRHLATGIGGSKFGIAAGDILPLAKYAADAPSLSFAGLSCHIGSQIKQSAAFVAAADAVAELRAQLDNAGIKTPIINMGGGFAADYDGEGEKINYAAIDEVYAARFADAESLLLEPGRRVCAAAGVLLCRVEYEKQADGKHYWIVDAGMNDLIRPALYDARHRIVAVCQQKKGEEKTGDIAGPVCESADIIAHQQTMRLAPGDLLAVLDAGAYGMTMACNYNARPRPCEVMVVGDSARLIRRREKAGELFAAELGL